MGKESLIALNLFCGGGGTALGLIAAGFDTVIGIDLVKPRDYPDIFIQAAIQIMKG